MLDGLRVSTAAALRRVAWWLDPPPPPKTPPPNFSARYVEIIERHLDRVGNLIDSELRVLQEHTHMLGQIQRSVLSEGEKRHMENEEVKGLLGQMNDATNAVATRIDTLLTKLTPGLSEDDTNELKAALSAEVARLQSLGSDPANPVPPESTTNG